MNRCSLCGHAVRELNHQKYLEGEVFCSRCLGLSHGEKLAAKQRRELIDILGRLSQILEKNGGLNE